MSNACIFGRKSMNKQLISLADRKKRQTKWKRLICVISCLVVIATTYSLSLPAISMEKTTSCGLEEHQHSDECYEERLVCGKEEAEEHHHTDKCYKVEKRQVCDKEEHMHAQDCYDDQGNLTCPIEEHSHSDECYQEDRVLSCSLEETDGHKHTDACYEKVLVCGKEEHTHSVECYEDEDKTNEDSRSAASGESAGEAGDPGSQGSAAGQEQGTGGEAAAEAGTTAEAAQEAVQFLEKGQLTFEGPDYTVTASFGREAMIPAGSALSVSEITDKDASYQEYTAGIQEALGWESGSPSYLRLFDIKILDEKGEKVEIAAPVDVRIDLADKETTKEAEDHTQVVHFADGAEEAEVVDDLEVDDGTVSFEAAGFSAYAIVEGPEPVPIEWERITSVDELIGMGNSGFYIGHPGGYYYGNTTTGDSSRTGIAKTKPAQSYPADDAARYYFEHVEGSENQFYAYCYAPDGTTRQYVYNGGNNSLSFTTEENRTAFTVSVDDSGKFSVNNGAWYWNMQGGANGTRFCSYNKAGDVNNQIYFWYKEDVESDPYDLDGVSYGLMNWNGGAAGKALMAASSSADSLEAKPLTVLTTSDNSDQLFVPNDSDISMWTFHWINDNKYYLTTVADASTRDLRIDDSGLSLAAERDEQCRIQVIPGSGTHEGEVCLKAGSSTLTYSGSLDGGFSVGGSAGSEWLHFVTLSELTNDYFRTYSAVKTSVSDPAVTNGSRVIVYTRSWNEEKKRYDFYAVGSDGTLVPVYESGDSIEWVGGQINKLLWNFTEYFWEGTTDPTYYYELYNQYSEKFIAPGITDGQILSDDPIGINLNGRRDGQYYSSIIAWDEENYAYAGLKVEDGRIVSCPKSEAMDFYFATMEDLNVDDQLHTVKTVDHTQYGIKMKMIDIGTRQEMSDFLGNNTGGAVTTLVQGLLSTSLGPDGFPTAAKQGGESLSELYGGAREVNHIFIDSIYNSSGYFEFNSTQNFASLQDDNNFKVYKELGSYDSAGSRNTLKHGQFFPFNDLQPGVFTSVNGQNLYSLSGQLPDSDPRKYEKLYSVENSGKAVDCYFAAALEASFTQTPDGLDAWGHDIIFEFTGDDDFWLYVDGELVIDLGGIHSAVPGSVNFRTGRVNVNGKWTTLRELFESNYRKRNPGASDSEVAEFLGRYFEEGSTIFRDNTNHTMNIFYMERGAGASNLHMRFNLAAVRQGSVQLTKKLSGVDDQESVLAEFPYQILYRKTNEEGVEEPQEYYLQNAIGHSSTQNMDYVCYKDSDKPVKYVQNAGIGGVTYNDVFFLKPGETADISFPEGMSSYRIVECGVNTEIYSSVKANGEELEAGSGPDYAAGRKDFATDYATTDARPRVTYDNTVREEALRNLTIRKKLYDESGNTPISYDQDQTEFKFRLYLASEYGDLAEAAMHTYFVKDADGYYCRWNTGEQKIEKIEGDISEYSALSEEQKAAAAFHTSLYGQITRIPADHTIEIRNVLAGTQYRVEERAAEIPDGYSFQRYDEYDTENAVEADRNTIAGINGIAVAGSDPNVTVRNLKGWGLRVNKIWSDQDYMSQRDPTYFAVFIRENPNNGQGVGDGNLTLVPDTVRQLPFGADPQTLYWYFDKLKDGTEISDYVIREVRLTGHDWEVQEDGTVTGISSGNVHSIHHTGRLKLGGTQKGETESSEFSYQVLYQEGQTSADSNVRVDTVTNDRPGIVLKKTQWDGSTPLAGSVFTLEDNEGSLIDTFTSDGEGLITTAFLREDVPYILTETDAPQGWYGLQTPVTITMSNREIHVSDADDSWYIVDNGAAMPTLTIKDRPCEFRAVKKDGSTGQGLAGVIFALHKQVTVDGVTAFDLNPMPGYEALTTSEDGTIPGLDNSLPAGTYELREKAAPSGYEDLSGCIRFSVSKTGVIRLIGTEQQPVPEGVVLTGPVETEDSDGTVSYELTVPNYRKADITLQKADEQGRELTGARFTLCRFEKTWQTVSGYEDIDMTQTAVKAIENLKSGRYRLTETAAPEDFIILSSHVYFNIGFDESGDVKITLTDEEGTGANTNINASADGIRITVKNDRGAALPSTGGPGTRIFMILGGVLTAFAGAVLLQRSRQTH